MKPFNYAEIIKKSKALVIIGAIIAFIIGALCIITPYYAGGILIWILIGLIGILGLGLIFRFIFPGKNNSRSGWALAGGIILVLGVTAIILTGIFAENIEFKGQVITGMEQMTIRLLCFGSIFFGLISIFDNIFLLFNVGNFAPGEKGFVIAKGILGIVIGVAILTFPFVMYIVSVIISGAYLIIMSITLIVLTAKISKAQKEAK